ncbi:hypothetical protein Pd630_LPD13058 (plasmid) [Rhodococcus opacus PD630]|nr:hypothetical protein Pd630_LPD13058 [Rhodococcus opacus PD630]
MGDFGSRTAVVNHGARVDAGAQLAVSRSKGSLREGGGPVAETSFPERAENEVHGTRSLPKGLALPI